MSGLFGGSKKTTTNQQQNSNSQLDTSGSQSSLTDAITQALTAGMSSNSSTGVQGTQSTGANTGVSSNTSTRNPWATAAPTLAAALQGLTGANAAAMPGILDAANSGVNYASSAYGGGPGFALGDVGASVQQILSGGGLGTTAGAGGDATAALTRMLSGTPDYAGVEASINAANAPILRQLNEDIIPGLNSRATFLNNPTGGIKTLNRVMPAVADRMSENAAQITEAERQRALRDQATGLQLFGSLAGQDKAAALQAAGMSPELLGLGLMPSQLQQGAAGLPLELAQSLASGVLPFASVGGSDTSTGTTAGTQSQAGTAQSMQDSISQNFQSSLQQAIQQMLAESASSSTGTESSTLNSTSKTKTSGGLGSILGSLLTLATLIPTGGMSALAGLGGGALGGAAGGLTGGSILSGTMAA